MTATGWLAMALVFIIAATVCWCGSLSQRITKLEQAKADQEAE